MCWSDTFWLTVTNAALGVAVGVFLAGVALAVLLELRAKWRSRYYEEEIDRDMREMFHKSKSHRG